MPRNEKGHVVGHRAALFAFVFALAAVVLLLFAPIPIDRNIDTPADAPPGCEVETTTTTEPVADATDESGDSGGDNQLTCRDSVTIPDELGLVAYPILLLPVAITGIAYWATTRDRQSRIWTFCLVGLAVFLVVFTIGGLLFVPSMVALTIASFQSRRAEQQLLQAQRASGGDDPAEPIETTAEERDEPEVVDEVEEVDVDADEQEAED
jgi:cytochrome bd-type quinol oxidase subunit 2